MREGGSGERNQEAKEGREGGQEVFAKRGRGRRQEDRKRPELCQLILAAAVLVAEQLFLS
eukprot:752162-Hanusia_phi.AAC.4